MAQTLSDPFIHRLEVELPKYLAGRRWYRAKAEEISALTTQDVLHLGGFLILVIKVQSGGREDLYLMPISSDAQSENGPSQQGQPVATLNGPDGERVLVHEAVSSPFFRKLLFQTLTESRRIEGRSGSLIAQCSVPANAAEPTMESIVSSAEQSNTSIIYGREYILKLFRKIEAGINPDIEMGRFLTDRGFKNTPAVLGTLQYKSETGAEYSAAILQQFVPNRGDAWSYTLDSLGEFLRRSLHATGDESGRLREYASSAALLGKRTAEMHTALADSTGDVDFDPESFSEGDAQRLANEISGEIDSSLSLLKSKMAGLANAERQLAEAVMRNESRLKDRLEKLSGIATDAKRIRHHGDYHLGQVLFTGTDFMIIDFEGEPARPLSERRAKSLTLRDVAGMLRSFQYAAYAGLYGLIANLPTDPDSAERIDSLSARWNSQVSKLYLEAYYDAARGQCYVPSRAEEARILLDAFLLQKALYEVRYELNNRPAWVGIPLRGILSLLES